VTHSPSSGCRRREAGGRRYRVSGLTLESGWPLPELLPVRTGGPPDLRVDLGRGELSRGAPDGCLVRWVTASGEPWLAAAREGDGYRLHFPGLADFQVDRAGREVVGRAGPAIPARTLRHLFLDHVLPRALSLRGRPVLHATAVLLPAGVCAFAGPAGAGKSTLAASFLAAGYPLVADDCLALDDGGRILAAPAYPGVRLWGDALARLGGPGEAGAPVAHYASKRRWARGAWRRSFPRAPRPLARVYVLVRSSAPAGPPRVERLPAPEALMALVGHSFRLDVLDRDRLAEEFRALARVAAEVPVSRLHVPEGLDRLPAVRQAVLADLEGRDDEARARA
jgi:hypothetical protein